MKLLLELNENDRKEINFPDDDACLQNLELFKAKIGDRLQINNLKSLMIFNAYWDCFVNFDDITILKDKSKLKVIVAPINSNNTNKVAEERGPVRPSSTSSIESIAVSINPSLSSAPTLRPSIVKLPWPMEFPLPNFDDQMHPAFGVFKIASDHYERTGKPYQPHRGEKALILTALANEILRYTYYPTLKQFHQVVEIMVRRHPCIRDPTDSQFGCESWLISLQHKLSEVRGKLRKNGVEELVVNGNKKSKRNPEALPPNSNINKPRKGEKEFLGVRYPPGEDQMSIERYEENLRELFTQEGPPVLAVSHLMDKTFGARRFALLEKTEDGKHIPIVNIIQRFPFIVERIQILRELKRICALDLDPQQIFYSSLDSVTPPLLEFFQKRGGQKGAKIQVVLQPLQQQGFQEMDEANKIDMRRSCVLRALPEYFGEKASMFIKDFEESADDYVVTKFEGKCKFIACFGDWRSNRAHYSVILEREQYFGECITLAEASLMYFASHYAFCLEYEEAPKTMQFMQCQLFGIGQAKEPTVKTLIRELARN